MGGAPFDTQLFVLADVDDGGSLKVAACNDNGCGPGSNLSSVEFQMMAGVGYGFIIDGAAGVSGAYKIRITAMEGAIEGQLPPSSLLTSKTRVVASTQPAASGELGGSMATLCAVGYDSRISCHTDVLYRCISRDMIFL